MKPFLILLVISIFFSQCNNKLIECDTYSEFNESVLYKRHYNAEASARISYDGTISIHIKEGNINWVGIYEYEIEKIGCQCSNGYDSEGNCTYPTPYHKGTGTIIFTSSTDLNCTNEIASWTFYTNFWHNIIIVDNRPCFYFEFALEKQIFGPMPPID